MSETKDFTFTDKGDFYFVFANNDHAACWMGMEGGNATRADDHKFIVAPLSVDELRNVMAENGFSHC